MKNKSKKNSNVHIKQNGFIYCLNCRIPFSHKLNLTTIKELKKKILNKTKKKHKKLFFFFKENNNKNKKIKKFIAFNKYMRKSKEQIKRTNNCKQRL